MLFSRRFWIIAIPLAVVVAVLGVLMIVRSATQAEPTTQITGTATVAEMLDGIPEKDGVIGSPDAPVLVTEFADLRCPACKQYSLEQLPETIAELVKTGKIRFDRQLWPITGGPPDGSTAQAYKAAYAGLAAREQDKLWMFTELFYHNQQSEAIEYVTDEFLDNLATESGLNVEQFRAARNNPKQFEDALIATLDATTEHGFTGTPSFLITGPGGVEKITGTLPSAAELKEAVDKVATA